MQSIGDALGIVYQGAEANYSHIGRASFANAALVDAFQIPAPKVHAPPPNIASMIAKESSGSPGDNLDVFA